MVRLLEHQGKGLLRSVGILTPAGKVASTSEVAGQIADELGKPVAIKAQISATGRFKAGGIGFADNPNETVKVAERILGTKIKGFVVREVLIEERLDVQSEFYAGVIVDDSSKVKGPEVMFSTRGGVDIEQVAAEQPEQVAKTQVDILDGLSLDDAKNLVRKMAVPPRICEDLTAIVHRVYQVFDRYDARSVEINPVVLASDQIVYAADCRVVVDESSVWKHPELGVDFPRDIGRAPNELERIAWKTEENDFRGIAYFVQMVPEIRPGDGCVGFHGIGGGGAMLGADALVRCGLKIANYADTSGNPTSSKVYRMVKAIFSQPNIEGYVLMGAVVANQEQWHHAHALVRALREELGNRPGFPVMILIAGNKERESMEILRRGLEGLPARIELYGREYVYNVDYIAQHMKQLVDNYRTSLGDQSRR